MKKERLLELAKELGMNEAGVKEGLKFDADGTEAAVLLGAKHMGLKI